MSVSTIALNAPPISSLPLVNLQQFEGTEVEMHFPDPSAFSQTSTIAQERAKAFFLHLEKKLSTQGRNKSPFQILLERISKLPQTKENRPLIAAITQAFFKQRGYLSGLFSDESWEEWNENRTALGKVAFLLRDCTVSSRRVSHCTLRLDESVIQQAIQEADALLKCLDHRDTATERSFRSEISCGTGLFGGIFGALLTHHPLPLLLGLSQCFPGVRAQQKVGREFQVNNYTFGTQAGPSVTSLGNGNFVVTWDSQGQDGSVEGVVGQLFYSNSTKMRSEFLVNTYTTSAQYGSSVASFNNDNFVVTWASLDQDGDNFGVYGQLFDTEANKTRSEFQINTYTISDQSGPSVANFNNGNFVVIWNSAGQDSSGGGVYGQLFGSIGNKIGSEFQANTHTDNHQRAPSVASLRNDNFVVAWHSQFQDGSGEGVFGQLFNVNATKIGNEFQINSFTNNSQQTPSVAGFSNENFVVVWESETQDGDGWGVYGQLFNENATRIGSEFQINSFTSGDQDTPSVASLNDSNFIVTWASNGQDGSFYGIYGQLFNKNATRIGNEFQINTFTSGDQDTPSVANLNNSNFVVTWHSQGQDGSDTGIYGQIFHDNITYPQTSSTTISSISSTTSSSTTSSSITSTTNSSTTITTSITTSNNRATLSATSDPNNRLLWLWLLLGIGGGTICLGGIGYLLRKLRRKDKNSSMFAEELGQIQHRNSSPSEEHYQRTPDHVGPGAAGQYGRVTEVSTHRGEYQYTPDHVGTDGRQYGRVTEVSTHGGK